MSGPVFSMACVSHTPLLFDEDLAPEDLSGRVRTSFDKMAKEISDFDPDLIIQFSPDHFHGFHYDNMPSFCVGAAAESYGDYGTAKGPLNVDEGLALALLDAVRDADIDASLSYSMCVDHGFVQMWEIMRGRFADLPIIPIFVNAIGHPLPTYRRARLLGEAVGRFAKERRGRILFAASGGLSHDPVVPRIRGADQTLRDRLLGRTQLSPEQQKARETQVKAAGLAALKGEGPCRPLNPQWDRHFLGLLRAREWDALDSRSTTEVDNEAGAGANEALCWVAAAAALSAAAGSFDVIQEDYEVATGWIAGLAHVYAIGAACRS